MRFPLFTALILLQATAAPVPVASRDRADVRAGLDTLYAGDFARAAVHFEEMSARDTTDPAGPIFHAGAYIWWASALDSISFERRRIDSLLALALTRARTAGPAADFWLATAHGYRARERDVHGETWGAARDGKAMRDAYRRVVRADTTCVDCFLGLGVYHYGLARAPGLAKFVAKIVGLGSGDADSAFAYLHRVAAEGDLARVEGAWVLASALVRDAARAKDPAQRARLQAEARAVVEQLAVRYPANPVFRRFLDEVPPPP